MRDTGSVISPLSTDSIVLRSTGRCHKRDQLIIVFVMVVAHGTVGPFIGLRVHFSRKLYVGSGAELLMLTP